MLSVDISEPRVPSRSIYQWADYIELSCLASEDREVSFEETLSEHWGGDQGLAGIFDAEDPEEENKTISARDADNKQRLYDLVLQLEMREALFKECYPFEVVREEGIVRMREGDVELGVQVYVYLLLASNLRFFSKPQQSVFTSDFELLAPPVLSELLGPGWTIAMFGTAPGYKGHAYTGLKAQKLQEMATDISGQIKETFLNRIKPEDVGDAGLDAIAFYPFKDGATHIPLLFSQSGCTFGEEDMLRKQDEASKYRWDKRMNGIWPVNMMISPCCFRDSTSNWVAPTEIRSIYIDRYRLVHLLGPKLDDAFLAGYSSLDYVSQVLN